MSNTILTPEPVAWVRRHPDGALTAEFLEDEAIELVRKQSGAWQPLITTAQAEAYADARVQEALEAVGAGGVSGQRITQPPTDEAQSAWFAGIDVGRDIERHNSQLANDARHHIESYATTIRRDFFSQGRGMTQPKIPAYGKFLALKKAKKA
jgi:hypothetical protein